MRLFIFLYLFFLIAFSSCRNTPAKDTASVRNYPKVSEGTPTELVVELEDFRLRATPSRDGETVSILKRNTALLTTGNISSDIQTLEIKGVKRTEPWIEVQLPSGEQGWVFGGGVRVEPHMQETPVAKILRKERLTAFFGEKRTKQIIQYRHDYIAAENSKDFENVFIRGSILRDSMSFEIYEALQIQHPNNLPELSWLEDALPGYQLGIVAGGTSFYLFQDLKKLEERARRTKGDEDDNFLELLSFIYGNEDREVFFPIWFKEVSESQGQSLLGKGMHIETLTKLDQLMQAQALFRSPILKLKRLVIEDILNENAKPSAYSESAESVLNEIDLILSSGLKILTNSDKARLERRKSFFQQKES